MVNIKVIDKIHYCKLQYLLGPLCLLQIKRMLLYYNVAVQGTAVHKINRSSDSCWFFKMMLYGSIQYEVCYKGTRNLKKIKLNTNKNIVYGFIFFK